jgi:hypothetical protein
VNPKSSAAIPQQSRSDSATIAQTIAQRLRSDCNNDRAAIAKPIAQRFRRNPHDF